MKELVEEYQKLKWQNEHSKKKRTGALKTYNHSKAISNNKIFQIRSDTELKNKEICPP